MHNDHFEIYAESADEASVRRALSWFEQLRTFFDKQTGLKTDQRSPTRVIGFASEPSYQPYRLGPSAHAYYLGTENRDYIVLPGIGASEFRVAAHEYAHLLLRRTGEKWPLWLNEGLAEFYSTIRITRIGSFMGGDIAAHLRFLHRNSWIAVSQLTRLTHQELWDSEARGAAFYAESWALTDMLLFSPDYGSSFRKLVAEFDSGGSSSTAFHSVYGKTTEAVERDLERWVRQHPETQMQMPGVETAGDSTPLRMLSDFDSRTVLADLLMANGELDRARLAYSQLAQERPNDGAAYAALGAIALRKKDYGHARDEWRRALDNGIEDPDLCLQYANLADSVDLPSDQIRGALQRAIALRPDFDNARYRLAVLESNAGNFVDAVNQFKSMRTVSRDRQFAYWSALAYALTQTEDWTGALAAANEAKKHAANEAERAQAVSLAYISQTDLTVRFTRDAAGQLRLVTTRVLRGTSDWNPFILPDDHMRAVTGNLTEIVCTAGNASGLVVESGTGRLSLSIADPKQIQVLHASGDFVCGQQSTPRTISVQYADNDGHAIVRGMDFQ